MTQGISKTHTHTIKIKLAQRSFHKLSQQRDNRLRENVGSMEHRKYEYMKIRKKEIDMDETMKKKYNRHFIKEQV